MLNHNDKNTYSDALFKHMDYRVDFGEISDLDETIQAVDMVSDVKEIETNSEMDISILDVAFNEAGPQEEEATLLAKVTISTSTQKAWDQLASVRLKDKKLNNIKMYFIIDEMDSKQISQENQTGFNEDAHDLFIKMSKAMGIDSNEFIIAGLHLIDETENYDVKALIMDEIDYYAPRGIATFGAQAASLLLGRTERLAKIHGQFLTTRLQNTKSEAKLIEWMPLFHPDLLLINPNMKKTAWVDMQKLMLRF